MRRGYGCLGEGMKIWVKKSRWGEGMTGLGEVKVWFLGEVRVLSLGEPRLPPAELKLARQQIHLKQVSSLTFFFWLRKKATISFLVTRLDRIIMGLLHCIRNQLQGTYLHIIISHALLRDSAGLTPHPPSTWRFLGFLFDFLLKWIFHSVSSHEFSLPLS